MENWLSVTARNGKLMTRYYLWVMETLSIHLFITNLLTVGTHSEVQFIKRFIKLHQWQI